jgi:hypothetical protein
MGLGCHYTRQQCHLVLVAPLEAVTLVFTQILSADVSWQIIKRDRNHQVELRSPVRGSLNLHFVCANGREHSSYHTMAGAERAAQDSKDFDL